jgi:hypothetical protein
MNQIVATIQTGAKTIGRSLALESPTILTGIGVAGLFTTTLLAVKATPKAMRLLDEERANKLSAWVNQTGEDKTSYPDNPILSKVDIVKITWRCYVPAALVGLATVGAIIGSNSINLRRNAALASIYSLTEATLREYQDKVVEQIGKNKEEKVRDAIAQDRLERHPINDKEVILTGKGETLFFDSLTSRYFKSDMETIRKIVNDFNYRLMSENYLSLNEFYTELGIERTTLGEDMGWDIENGQIDVDYHAKIAKDGVTPCIVLDYRIVPGPCTYKR